MNTNDKPGGNKYRSVFNCSPETLGLLPDHLSGRKHTNLPRAELFARAQQALKEMPPGTEVYFRYTCAKCGSRRTLSDPNTLHENGECECGHVQPITEGGFSLLVPVNPTGATPCQP